jgi:single stranded DNA-binding protein
LDCLQTIPTFGEIRITANAKRRRGFVGQFLHKGSRIYLEGKIKTRSYEDKNGGKKYVTEIIADSFLLLDKPSDKAEINASFWK